MKKIVKFLIFKDYRFLIYMAFFIKTENKFIRKILSGKMRSNYNVTISPNSIIKKHLIFPHPQNIVIGEGAIIGENCKIYQNVTIGQNKGKYPSLENDVIVYSGATIVGAVTIGEKAIIGANSVVTKDVPKNAIFAGNPAKFIKYRGDNDEFY